MNLEEKIPSCYLTINRTTDYNCLKGVLRWIMEAYVKRMGRWLKDENSILKSLKVPVRRMSPADEHLSPVF